MIIATEWAAPIVAVVKSDQKSVLVCYAGEKEDVCSQNWI